MRDRRADPPSRASVRASDHPSSARSWRPSRRSFSLASRARVARVRETGTRFSAVRLGRRVRTGLRGRERGRGRGRGRGDGQGVGGGGRGEKALSHSHVCRVKSARARGVPPYHRRRGTREDEHRPGPAVITPTMTMAMTARTTTRCSRRDCCFLLFLVGARLSLFARVFLVRSTWGTPVRLDCRRPTDGRTRERFNTHGLTRLRHGAGHGSARVPVAERAPNGDGGRGEPGR